MKLLSKIILLLGIIFTILYFTGSRPDEFVVDPKISSLDQFRLNLDEYVATEEAHHDFRPETEARIVWADSAKSKTKYALVYLHGFSASHVEGAPTHERLAKKFGMNLYLSRLYDHGLNDNKPLSRLVADKYVESAKKAIQIGAKLGDEVIVIGTSTGATLAAYLAAYNPEVIDGLLLFSPNIDMSDPRSSMLTWPWGKELSVLLEGEEFEHKHKSAAFKTYWYGSFTTTSLVELKSLIDHTMTTENFKKIKQPLFINYYFKNEDQKDEVISIDRLKQFFAQVSTPKNQKELNTSPESGDHVTISPITSSDIETPFVQASNFLENVMGIEPILKAE